MFFKKTPVRQFRYDAVCDRCGEGVLIYTGKDSHSMHPMMQHLGGNKYFHKCNKCEAVKLAPEQWPRIVLEDDGASELIEFPAKPKSDGSPAG